MGIYLRFSGREISMNGQKGCVSRLPFDLPFNDTRRSHDNICPFYSFLSNLNERVSSSVTDNEVDGTAVQLIHSIDCISLCY